MPESLISCRPQASNFIKEETLAQVFSCEFGEIPKNTFSYRTLPVAASDSVWNTPGHCFYCYAERTITFTVLEIFGIKINFFFIGGI